MEKYESMEYWRPRCQKEHDDAALKMHVAEDRFNPDDESTRFDHHLAIAEYMRLTRPRGADLTAPDL
jgi:hypothetical protein